MMKLVKFQRDWSDEFDVFSLELEEDSRLENLEERLKNYFSKNKTMTIGFGTNEFFEFEFPSEILYSIEIHDIDGEVLEYFQTNIVSRYCRAFGPGIIGAVLDILNETEKSD